MLNKKFITGLATVILVFIGVFVFAQNRSEEDLLKDDVPPVIKLLGETPVKVEFGSSYKDAGATAKDDVDGDITSKIKKEGKVDTTKLGVYTIVYNVKDEAGNRAKEAKRIVNVVDTTKPTISLYGKFTVTVPLDGTYTDAGATAWDNVDGVLTSSIVTHNDVNIHKLGTYYVTYTVKDSSGNTTQAKRTVNVVDVTVPVITILGNNPTIINQGSTYTDSGATALDDTDGNITSKIVTSSNVNTALVGTYYVTYNVTDAAGNKAIEAVRTVKVVDGDKPVIIMDKYGEGTDVIIKVDKTHKDMYDDLALGATLTDNVDPNKPVTDITIVVKGTNITVSSIDTSVLGEYQVFYNGTDSVGNIANPAIRNVSVVDSTDPEITLIDDEVIEINLSSESYVDAGATANDNYYGSLVPTISSNDVNPGLVGTYHVTYTVVDGSGNDDTATRTVIVKPIIEDVKSYYLETGTPYVPRTVSARYSLTEAPAPVIPTGTVDITTPGDYQIVYNYTYNEIAADTQYATVYVRNSEFDETSISFSPDTDITNIATKKVTITVTNTAIDSDEDAELDPASYHYIVLDKDVYNDSNKPTESDFSGSNSFTSGNENSITILGNGKKYYVWALVKDMLGHTTIVRSNIMYFDNEGPKISFDPNINKSYYRTRDIEISVTDDNNIIPSSLRYLILKTADYNDLNKPTKALFDSQGHPFTNEDEFEIELPESNVPYYIWVYAEDSFVLSNIAHSGLMVADKEGPTASFTYTTDPLNHNIKKVKIDVSDLYNNVKADSLRYILVKNGGSGSWQTFTNGQTISIQLDPTKNDYYYLWVYAEDEALNDSFSQSLSIQEDPIVTFDPNSDNHKTQTKNVTITVSDQFDNIKASSLRYVVLRDNAPAPDKAYFDSHGISFTSGASNSIILPEKDKNYYIWVYAEDNLDNPVFIHSGNMKWD